MLKEILSVSGRPGLFKLISQGKNMYIVESLADGKRIPTYPRDKVVSLGDISIYTYEEDIPLAQVMESIKDKLNGEKVSIPAAQTPEMKRFFAEVLPNYDEERVYPSDIKKLFAWYNLLLDAGYTTFVSAEEEATTPTEEAEEAATEA